MAPKTAMKAMKTATKGPKSVKPTRATAAKGKSKNAKDKSNKSVTDELKVYNFKNSVGNHTSVLGRYAKVNFSHIFSSSQHRDTWRILHMLYTPSL